MLQNNKYRRLDIRLKQGNNLVWCPWTWLGVRSRPYKLD